MIEMSIVRDPLKGVDVAETDAMSLPDPDTPSVTDGEAENGIVEDPIFEVTDPSSEESAGPADAVGPNASLAAEVESLGDRIEELRRATAETGQIVSELITRDEMTARIHERLTRYEENAWERRYLDPLTRGIASLHRRILDQLTMLERSLRSIPSGLRQHSMECWTQGTLDGVRAELETVLSDLGIELVVVDGSRFDRSSQEAVQRIPASDTSQVGRVAQRLAPGFRVGDRVIIPERVAVYIRTSDAVS